MLVELAEPAPCSRSPDTDSISSVVFGLFVRSIFLADFGALRLLSWVADQPEEDLVDASPGGSSLTSARNLVRCWAVLELFRCCNTDGAVGKKSANLPVGRDITKSQHPCQHNIAH